MTHPLWNEQQSVSVVRKPVTHLTLVINVFVMTLTYKENIDNWCSTFPNILYMTTGSLQMEYDNVGRLTWTQSTFYM